MNPEQLKRIKGGLENLPEVRLAYFFGSKASGNDGPLSDYDFAFYCAQDGKKGFLDVHLKIYNLLTDVLKTDKIDIVMLNSAKSPELKYQIISKGQLIFVREPYQLIVEPQVLNSYFDFYCNLKKYNLTKA